MLFQGRRGSVNDLHQNLVISSVINVFIDTDNGAADEARFFQHEFDEVFIGQGVLLQTHCLEAGTAEIEHIRSRLSLEQVFDFRAVERFLEEVAFVDFYPFLQEKLSRFSTRASRYPAVKIDFHGHSSSFSRFTQCFQSVSLCVSRLPVFEHSINICLHIAHFYFSSGTRHPFLFTTREISASIAPRPSPVSTVVETA